MDKRIDIPVPGVVNVDAAKKRREDYAYTRDLQALEYNEAIAKRGLTKARNLAKCEKCGKEFNTETTSEDSLICPECSQP